MQKSSGVALKDVTWVIWLLATIPLFWFMITEGRKREKDQERQFVERVVLLEEFCKDVPHSTSLDQMQALASNDWLQYARPPSFCVDRRGERLVKIVLSDGNDASAWAMTYLSLDQVSYDFVVAHKERPFSEIVALWRVEHEKK